MAKKDGRARRRPLVIGACALLLLVVVAIPTIWWIARDQIATAVTSAQRDAARDGVRLEHEGLSFSGFPFTLSAELANPRAHWGAGSWRGPEILIGETSFSDPTLLRFDGSGKHRFDLNGIKLTLDSREAEALVEVGERGLEAIEAALRQTDLNLAKDLGKAKLKRLDLTAAPLPPLLSAEQKTAVALDLRSLSLPAVIGMQLPSLGTEIESGSLRADLSGPLSPGPAPAVLQAWRLGGGSLDLKELALTWGPFSVEAAGRLGLDQALRPSGTLNLQLSGAPPILDALAVLGILDPALAKTYGGLLGGMALPRAGKPGRWIALPLVLRDGRAYLKLPLGQIPLTRLQPIVPTG